jgi:hypothetical protein
LEPSVAARFDISLSFSDDETFVFALDFKNNDGTVFALNQARFKFTVKD